MIRFAELAAAGRRSLDDGTAAQRWPALLNQAFELRSSIWNITPIDRQLVDTGQAIGAGVAFAGSGGAVVGATTNVAALADAARAYDTAGAGFLVLHPGAHQCA